jgi:hypothetical protein
MVGNGNFKSYNLDICQERGKWLTGAETVPKSSNTSITLCACDVGFVGQYCQTGLTTCFRI